MFEFRRSLGLTILCSLTIGIAVWTPRSYAVDECIEWFKKSGVRPSTPNCTLKCSSIGTDMGTFDCPNRCQNLCQSAGSPCSLDPFWQKALQANPSPFRKLEGKEQEQVMRALHRMPKIFKPKSLKGIVRASEPVDITALTSPAMSSNEFIILFPRAFSPDASLDRILVHEATHLMILSEWAKTFSDYKKQSGWSRSSPRAGDFVDADGRFSPEEDFANNVEFYLFDAGKLKSTSPKIFHWIEINLNRLKMEKSCD